MKYQLADLIFSSKTKIVMFFKQMRDKYMKVLNQPITDSSDFELTDSLLKEQWIRYHREHAHLKALSSQDHRREHAGRAN